MRWLELQRVSVSRVEERHSQGWLGVQGQRDPGTDPPVGAWPDDPPEREEQR